MILHDRYKNSVIGRKTEFCGWFCLRPHFIVADWMTAFLWVRSFSFHNYMNDRSDWSINSQRQFEHRDSVTNNPNNSYDSWDLVI